MPLRHSENPRDGRCDICAYWDEHGDDVSGIYGLCRLNAPRVSKRKGSEGQAIWPTTYGNDWCGYFVVNEDLEEDPFGLGEVRAEGNG